MSHCFPRGFLHFRPIPGTPSTDSPSPPPQASASTENFVLSPQSPSKNSLKTPEPNNSNSASTSTLQSNSNHSNGTSKFAIPDSMVKMFSGDEISNRPAPEMPDTSGLDYPRAASWSSSTVAEIMNDKIGKQLFRCFLYESLAEENLIFIERMQELQKVKDSEEFRKGLNDIMEAYEPYINISGVAKNKIMEFATGQTEDRKVIDPAIKEVNKLLESDQFPRFRRSPLYQRFLENLLPRAYAERWKTSFEALLGNQVGRHHFRQYLAQVHAEENLRFWEAVKEFKNVKNKSQAMLNMARSIMQQFLSEGCNNEVFLPFNLRQNLIQKIKDRDMDVTLFDDAVKHVEQVLKNDPYVRFLQSDNYKDLLKKLH